MRLLSKGTFLRDVAEIAIGGAVGFSLFWLTSHPTKSPIRKRIPHKRIKNISLLPEIKVYKEDKHYHVHHWFSLSTLYALLLLKRKKFLKFKFLHGLFWGGILQGLSYKDRFRIIHPVKLTPQDSPQAHEK